MARATYRDRGERFSLIVWCVLGVAAIEVVYFLFSWKIDVLWDPFTYLQAVVALVPAVLFGVLIGRRSLRAGVAIAVMSVPCMLVLMMFGQTVAYLQTQRERAAAEVAKKEKEARIVDAAKAHKEALDELSRIDLLDVQSVASREELEARKAKIQRFLEANVALTRLVEESPAADEQRQRDQRLASEMLDVLDLFATRWGHWQVDRRNVIVFESAEDLARYHTLTGAVRASYEERTKKSRVFLPAEATERAVTRSPSNASTSPSTSATPRR